METTTAPLLTASQAARRLGISRRTVYRWIESDQLPAVEIAGMTRIPTAALEAWLEEHERRANQPLSSKARAASARISASGDETVASP